MLLKSAAWALGQSKKLLFDVSVTSHIYSCCEVSQGLDHRGGEFNTMRQHRCSVPRDRKRWGGFVTTTIKRKRKIYTVTFFCDSYCFIMINWFSTVRDEGIQMEDRDVLRSMSQPEPRSQLQTLGLSSDATSAAAAAAKISKYIIFCNHHRTWYLVSV